MKVPGKTRESNRVLLYGVHEINGEDTAIGADTCSKIARILNELGFKAEYKKLDNEFDCDISISLSISIINGNTNLDMTFGNSGFSCSAIHIPADKLNNWVDQCMKYFNGLGLVNETGLTSRFSEDVVNPVP